MNGWMNKQPIRVEFPYRILSFISMGRQWENATSDYLFQKDDHSRKTISKDQRLLVKGGTLMKAEQQVRHEILMFTVTC